MKHTVCSNCEQEFDIKFDFCPHCGQRNKKLELSLKFFLHDFLSSSFNLDSKIFQTLKLLIFYPAQLTKSFLAGKRASFVPPVRLYLIISLVYFTLLSFSDYDIVEWQDDQGNELVVDSAKATDSDSLNSITMLPDSVNGKSLVPKKKKAEDLVLTFDDFSGDNQKSIDKLIDSLNINSNDDGRVGKFFLDRIKKLNTKEGKSTFKELLQKYTSLGMFVLMPITALLFFMLFSKKTYYIQHLVFVLHLQSMMYILFIIFNLLGMLFNNSFFEILNVLLFLFILIIWVKKFYNIKWRKSIGKSILFLLMYGVCFVLFFVVIAAISAWNL